MSQFHAIFPPKDLVALGNYPSHLVARDDEEVKSVPHTATIVIPMSEFSSESVTTIETTLNNVDRALERLRLGSYRTCQVCQTPIDEEILVASPLLANCPAHPELA